MTAEAKRRAIVWHTIERLAFMPDNREKWLAIYRRSLHKLWQLEPGPTPTHSSFQAVFLDVECKYSIEAAGKYSVSIVKASTAAPCCWCVEVDPAFSSKASFYAPSPSDTYPLKDLAKHLRYDVESVLDGMIFHPRAHAHGDTIGIMTGFDANGAALSTHEVRLGGGVENAFVFLAHLRYQFCLLCDEARNQERSRLVHLFKKSIEEKCNTVPPADLFGLR